jgi:tol-pal system-associated acyl-CoA thioesterase
MPKDVPGDDGAFEIRVYYEDTDAGGVVYYANYLKFFERARTEWLRQQGVDQSLLAETERRLFVVKNVEIQYRRPARLDNQLTIHTQVGHMGRASIQFEQKALRGDELLCDGTVTVCCVDADSFRPIDLGPTIRSLLK